MALGYGNQSFDPQVFYQAREAYNQAMNNSGLTWDDVSRQQMSGYDMPNAHKPYYANQGTDYMYNGQYRSANAAENFAINLHNVGDYLMNWQQVFAGPDATEEERDAFRFHPENFDFGDANKWASGENLAEIGKFAVSLPGQMIGGLLQAPGQLIGEVAFGDPYTEYKKNQKTGEAVLDKDGNYLIPDYTLDAGQRFGQAVNAGINIAGAFTGGGGRVVGSLGKAAMTSGLKKNFVGMLDEAGQEITEQGAKQYAKNFAKNYQRLNKEDRERVLANLSRPNAEGVTMLTDEEAAKIAKYSTKVARWENRQKGVVDRIYEQATGKDSAAAGRWAQAGFDALQEGGEEFVQQFAEQGGRYKQEVTMEDALTAAAWGMAGGGVMSVAGGFLGGRNPGVADDKHDQLQDSTFTHDFSDFDYLAKHQGSYQSAAARQRLTEELARTTRQKASGLGTNVTWSKNYMQHEGGIGILNLQETYFQDDESKKTMAEKLGTDVATLDDIFEFDRTNDEDVHIAQKKLQDLIDANFKGRGVKIAIGRSPSTQNGGAYIYLTTILDNEGIELNPMTYAQYGSDVDGDKTFYYFDTDLFPGLGFASAFISEPELRYDENDNRIAANSPVPYWYSALFHARLETDEDIQDFVDRIDHILSAFKTEKDGKSLSQYFTDKIVDILTSTTLDEDGVNSSLAMVFTEMQQETQSAINDYNEALASNNQALADSIIDPQVVSTLNAEGNWFKNGMDVYGRVLQQFTGENPKEVVKILLDAKMENTVRIAERAWEQTGQSGTLQEFVGELVESKPSIKGVLHTLQDRGEIEGVNTVAQTYHALGLIYTMLVSSGNPIYRQYAQLYYPFGKQIPGQYFEGIMADMSAEELQPILHVFLRASFGMTSMGVDPTISINGILQATIISEMKKQGVLDPTSYSDNHRAADLKTLKESFLEIRNSLVQDQNNAMKAMTTRGQNDYGAILWEKIDDTESDKFYDEFIRVFSHVPIKYIVDPKYLPDVDGNMPLGYFMSEYSKDPNAFDGIGVNISPEYTSFFIKIAERYAQSIPKSRANVIAAFDEMRFGDAMKTFSETTTLDSDGNFGMYTVAVYNGIDGMVHIMDPVMAWRAGLLDPKAIAKTKFGQKLFSDDTTGKEKANALCSLTLYTKFKHAYLKLKGLKDKDEAELEKFKKDLADNGRPTDEDMVALAEELSYLADIDYAHEFIVASFLDGNFGWFEALADPNIDLETKDKIFKEVIKDKDPAADFIISSLTTKNSEFAVGEITTRVNQARTYTKQANQEINKKVIEQVDEIAKDNAIQTEEAFHEWFSHATMSSRTKFNAEVLIGQIWESAIFAHEGVEKGTIQLIASQKYSGLAISENGGASSYQQDLFDGTFGEYTLDHARQNIKLILDCLHDPDQVFTVKDPATGRIGTMCCATLFKASDIDVAVGVRPSRSQVIKFLRKNPNIASYLGQRSVSYTMEGAKPSIDQDILSSFQAWKEAREKGVGKKGITAQQVNQGLMDTENWLVNNPNYMTLLISCCARKIEELSEFSVVNIRKIVMDTHEQLVRGIYVNAHKAEGGTASSISKQDFMHRAQAELNSRLRAMSGQIKLITKSSRRLSSQSIKNLNQFITTQHRVELLQDLEQHLGVHGLVELYKNDIYAFKRAIRESLNRYDIRLDEALSRLKQIEAFVYHRVNQPSAVINKMSDDELNELAQFAYDSNLKNMGFSFDESLQFIQTYVEAFEGGLSQRVSEANDGFNYENIFIGNDDIEIVQTVDPKTGEIKREVRAKDSLYDKVKNLYHMIGKAEPKPKDLEKEVKDCLKNVDDFNNLWVNKIFDHDVDVVESVAMTGFNKAATSQLMDLDTLWHQMFHSETDGSRQSLVDYLYEHGTLFDRSDSDVYDAVSEFGIASMPSPDPSSEFAQIMISNCRIMDDAAGTNVQVSLNGGQLKLHHGLGFLPGSSGRQPTPQMMTLQELEDLVEADINTNLQYVRVPGIDREITVATLLESREYEQTRTLLKVSGEKISYYNPLYNAHGLDSICIPFGYDKSNNGTNLPWHRLTHMIDKIDVTAMEAMVMKAKKKFAKGKFVVNVKNFVKRHLGSATQDQIDLNDFQNMTIDPETGLSVAQQSMQDLLVQIREQYALILMEEFDGRLSSLGWGMPQARMLACFLTPGLKVTVRGSNQTKQVVIDANYIFGSAEEFSSYLDAQTSFLINDEQAASELQGTREPGTISQVEQFTVSPTDISYRIMNAMYGRLDDSTVRKNQDGDPVYRRKDYEPIALNALDWSDYAFETLNMNEVLHFVQPCTDTIYQGLRTSDSPNPPQILLDSLTNGAYGSHNSISRARTKNNHIDLSSESNKARVKTAKNIADFVTVDEDGKQAVPAIMKIFGDPDSNANSIIDIRQYHTLRDHLPADYGLGEAVHYTENGVNSSVLVLSRSKEDLRAAAEYAVMSGNSLLIPYEDDSFTVDETIAQLKRLKSSTDGAMFSEPINIKIGGKTLQFVKIKIAPDISGVIQSARMATSHRITRKVRNIKKILVDNGDEFGVTDAGVRVTSFGGGNIGVQGGNWATFDVYELFKNRSGQEVRVISSPEEINKMLEDMGGTDVNIDQMRNWEEPPFDDNLYEDQTYKSDRKNFKISQYLKKAQNGEVGQNGVVERGAGAGEVIAMLYDGDKYMPVFGPKNSMRSYDGYSIFMWGNMLYIPWSGNTNLYQGIKDGENTGSSVHVKLSIFDEIAFKGIATVMPETVNGNVQYKMIRSGLGDNGRGIMDTIDFIISGETFGGRAKGRDLQIMKHNLAEACMEYGGSFIYDKNGRYKPVVQQLISSGRISESDLIDFLNNNRDAALKVLSGELYFTTDPDVNALIISVVRNCYENNAPWSTAISRIGKDRLGNMRWDDDSFNYHLAFNGFDENDLLKFYHGMGRFVPLDGSNEYIYLTPDGAYDTDTYAYKPGWGASREGSEKHIAHPNSLFNVYGETWVVMDKVVNGTEKRDGGWYLVLYGEPRVTGSVSDMTIPGYRSSIAFQQRLTSGLDQGYTPRIDISDVRNKERVNMLEYSEILLHHNRFASELFQARAEERRKKGELDWSFLDDINTAIKPGESWGQYERSQRVMANKHTLIRPRKIYMVENGEHVAIEPGSAEWNEHIQQEINRLKSAWGWDGVLTFEFADMFVRGQIGSTVDSNSKNNDIFVDDWKHSIDDLISGIERQKRNNEELPLPILVYTDDSNVKGRFALPWITRYQIDMLLEHSSYFRDAYGIQSGEDFHASLENARRLFIDAMKIEGNQALLAIERSADRAQKLRLYEFAEWIHKELGIPFTNNKHIYNNVYEEDFVKACERAVDLLNVLGEVEPSDIHALLEKMQGNLDYIKKIKNNLEKRQKDATVVSGSSPSGTSTTRYYDACYAENALLDRATQWVQFMAMLDPFMTVANISDRGFHQSIRRRLIKMAKKGTWIGKVFSPYHFTDPAHALTEEDIHNVTNQKDFMEFLIAVREAAFNGKTQEFVAEASQQGTNMLNWLREQKKGGKWAKIIKGGFTIGTGGNFGLKQQASIFLDTWVQIIENDPVLTNFWLTPDENGETRFHAMVTGDGNALNWLLQCLGGKGRTAELQETLQALQQSRVGDLAQKNTFAVLLQDIVGRAPGGNLAFATLVCKFPNYSFNILHRMVNWIFPASTAYYLFTEYMAGTKTGERLNIDENQMHSSLRQAFQVDMLHMGASLVAMVLIGASGMLEPPDDDRYLCNLDEWLFFGHRVRDVWWVHDLLGMALPVAAFGKSCLIGKPQVSIIFEGINDACASNPFLKASDALGMFFDPEGNIFEQYENAKEEYENAPGGGPENIFEFLSANATSGAARIVGQFITPAFVREMSRFGDYEHSYKYVFASDKFGGEQDSTKVTRTTYSDAMLRKYLRSNPWMATILDAFPHGTTGYREDEMPYTIYYDQDQMASARENAEKNPVAIITTLEQYRYNMEELQATGFYIDGDTKAAVSRQIWDNYYSWKTEWNRFAANEGKDYTSLGGGDFTVGKEMYYEYKELCESNQRYWKQFYYDTIKNSYLSQPMQAYYRYKTDYDIDATGQVYATGFHRGTLLPWETAPGTLTDPEGTAGYENSFDSVSAVTGNPITGMRALVPIEQGYTEWPEFEEWSMDQSGNSFSSDYAGSSNGSTPSESSGTPTTTSSKKSGGSGGGGGGGRSGGSYSRGYQQPPHLYIYNNSSPISKPSRIMSADRLEEADTVSYLRPDFETKGSREAYKRSDI